MKMFCSFFVLSAVLLQVGCGSAPPLPPEEKEPEKEPQAPVKPRLIHRQTGLFVLDLPGVYHRGQQLYVTDKDPLAPGHGHERIGMVKVVEPNPLKVAWYCRPALRFVQLLENGTPLPVEPLKADTGIRVSKCWGNFLEQNDDGWRDEAEVVDLVLNLGEGDGVSTGEIYEVLANPKVDSNTLNVISTERVGQCAIQDHEVTIDRSICRLHKPSWPEFSREMWIRGGYVHLQQQKAPETRWIDLNNGGVRSFGEQGPACRVEDGALVVTTQGQRIGDFSMCCVDLIHSLDDLKTFQLGLADIETEKPERVDVKLEMADTENQIFLAFQQETSGASSLKKVFTAAERAFTPNRICIAGMDTVPSNTIKLHRIGLSTVNAK